MAIHGWRICQTLQWPFWTLAACPSKPLSLIERLPAVAAMSSACHGAKGCLKLFKIHHGTHDTRAAGKPNQLTPTCLFFSSNWELFIHLRSLWSLFSREFYRPPPDRLLRSGPSGDDQPKWGNREASRPPQHDTRDVSWWILYGFVHLKAS